MSGAPGSRLHALAAAASILSIGCFFGGIQKVSADPKEMREGRFLYAGDDDWDWASPLGAEVPSKLSRYGAMPWSALDWAEDGLEEVRGVLVGTPPKVGKYITMEGLSELRGEHTRYEHHPQEDGVIAKLRAGKSPPDVIILMQDTGKGGRLSDDDTKELADFVKKGGRLVVLDDWVRYPPVLEAVLEAALALPKAPHAPAAPPEEGAVPPPEPAGADPEFVDRVRGLVADLGNAHFKIRESAMEELRKLGLPAVELAVELRPDDPEIAARLERLGVQLKPKPPGGPGLVTNESRRKKHRAAAERVRAAAEKLERVEVSHSVETIFVDKENASLAALKLVFPAR